MYVALEIQEDSSSILWYSNCIKSLASVLYIQYIISEYKVLAVCEKNPGEIMSDYNKIKYVYYSCSQGAEKESLRSLTVTICLSNNVHCVYTFHIFCYCSFISHIGDTSVFTPLTKTEVSPSKHVRYI